MKLNVAASPEIYGIITNLGRTEDLRFSPSGRRLALVGFTKSCIAVFETSFHSDGSISLDRAAEITSPTLNHPHGVDFLDEDRIVVANRLGAATIFRLPPLEETPRSHQLQPLETIPADATTGLHTPGSVGAVPERDGGHSLLFCNNYAHSVTRHTLRADGVLIASHLLLRGGLGTPDGLAVSRDRRWLAISNHDTQSILIYDYDAALGPERKPAAVLRGLQYPHGLRFTEDGRHLAVADGGAPLVHFYPRPEDGWHGTIYPAVSHRVMTDEVFQKGHYNEAEGGPKGLDIAPGQLMMVLTSRFQPLALFDLAPLLELSEAYATLRLTGPISKNTVEID